MRGEIKQLPVFDTISVSWGMTNGTKKTFWAAIAIIVLIATGFAIIGAITQNVPAYSHAVQFIHSIVQYLLQAGVVYIAINRVFAKPIAYDQMFHAFDLDIMLRLIGVYLLQLLLFLPLFVLAIIAYAFWDSNSSMMMFSSGLIEIIIGFATLYLLVRISFAQLFILDKGTNPWPAIKYSFAATRCNFWRVLAIRLLMSLILAIATIPLGIGLIWAIPLAVIVVAEMYKTLLVNTPVA